MITFEGVSKVYPDGTVAVEQLDMELPTGELTVLVGPSGCGKTTSLRMINRMVTPTTGRVLIDGVDVAGQDEALLRRGIGYVIQARRPVPAPHDRREHHDRARCSSARARRRPAPPRSS